MEAPAQFYENIKERPHGRQVASVSSFSQEEIKDEERRYQDI